MAARETAWTTYWQANRLDSCIGQEHHGATDQAAIFQFWQQFLEDMPGGGQVLDLATGNGAVALRLAEAAKRADKGLSIKAVDLADIRPSEYLKDYEALARGIEFLGGIDICALPFSDHLFDGVVSQFGFEYADHVAAVAELARVLKPGGRFQLLVHHADGALVAPNVAQIREIETLLRAGGLVDGIQQVLSAPAGADSPQMEQLEEEGRQLLAAYDNQLPRITAEIFEAVRQLLSRNDLALDIRLQGTADMRRRLEAECERMRQLGQAALSDGAAAKLAKLMAEVGLIDVAYAPFRVGADDALLGWQFSGGK